MVCGQPGPFKVSVKTDLPGPDAGVCEKCFIAGRSRERTQAMMAALQAVVTEAKAIVLGREAEGRMRIALGRLQDLGMAYWVEAGMPIPEDL
jgi:hypothetical protein